jgi:SPP1 gp7 family putative phage head morphogenesis protein
LILLYNRTFVKDLPESQLMSDQSDPSNWPGWRRVRRGLWRGPDGQTWRSWREYGYRSGHYPDVEWARSASREARAAEREFAARLRQVSTQISQLIRGTFNPDDPNDPGWDAMEDILYRYREMLRPWAGQVARRMLADVSRRDASGWHKLGREIGRALRREVEGAPIQDALEQSYNNTIDLILDLPQRATEQLRQSREHSADIIYQMRQEGEQAVIGGRRWEQMVDQVKAAGLDTQSSAETIARTETARAHNAVQAARAKHLGVGTFQWMTSNDLEVRPLHRNLARGLDANGNKIGLGGGIYRYDDLPLLDDGRPGLPGSIYNCRCYQLPILPTIPD